VVEVATLDSVLKREQAGTLFPGEVVERFPDNSIARIIVPYRNEGEQKANGATTVLQ